MKKLMFKCGGAIANLALLVTTMNVNTTCMLFAYQPKLPVGSEKLRKF